MKPQSVIIFTISTFIIGFMLAVQFQTIKKPDVLDKRSIWELRDELEKEKQKQVQLNAEISQYEILLNEYQKKNDQERIAAMKEALHKLKAQAGLTTINGKGMILRIEPLFNEEFIGEEVPMLSAVLLRRLINQLNMFGVEHISVDHQRVIAWTAIREVNGEIYVNNRPLPDLPIEIQIISQDVAKLFDQFKASRLSDEFATENLLLTAELKNNIYLLPFDRKIDVKYMQQYREGS